MKNIVVKKKTYYLDYVLFKRVSSFPTSERFDCMKSMNITELKQFLVTKANKDGRRFTDVLLMKIVCRYRSKLRMLNIQAFEHEQVAKEHRIPFYF